jgi:beta-N-acetylhexosaminidase
MPLDEIKTIDAIEKAVTSGRINEERIDKSVEKILKAKQWLGLFENRTVQEADVWKSINTGEAGDIAQQIADESITLVKDNNNLLPVSPGKRNAVIVISEGGESDNVSYLNSALPSYFNNYDYMMSYQTDLSSIAAYDNVIIAVYAKVRFGTGKISISSENSALIESINSKNKNTIVVSLGNPYMLKEFPSIPSYICAYGDSDVSINSVLKAITGKIRFKGKLPVSVTDDYKFGSGLTK